MPCMFALGGHLHEDLLQAEGVIQLLSFGSCNWGGLAKVELSFVAFGILEKIDASEYFEINKLQKVPGVSLDLSPAACPWPARC